MTDKVKIILNDNQKYNELCFKCAEQGREISEEEKRFFLTRDEREKILKSMTGEEIDCLINASQSNQAKSYYAKFKDKKTNDDFSVEAVPGPAFIVERGKWEKMQKNNKIENDMKKYQPFFDKVNKNSKKKKDNDLSI